MRSIRTGFLACLAVVAIVNTGCLWRGRYGVGVYGAAYVQRPMITATVVAPRAVIVAQPVAVPQGVIVVQQQCVQGAPEACNGLDDNCNGVIDEGCGYSGGQVQITAAWQGPADVDLHVTDPGGEHIYYGHRGSASGGQLDRDANAGCGGGGVAVENVFWGGAAPPGQYAARVHLYGACGMPAVNVTLSVSVGGRVLGSWQYTLHGGQPEFTIPFNVQ